MLNVTKLLSADVGCWITACSAARFISLLADTVRLRRCEQCDTHTTHNHITRTFGIALAALHLLSPIPPVLCPRRCHPSHTSDPSPPIPLQHRAWISTNSHRCTAPSLLSHVCHYPRPQGAHQPTAEQEADGQPRSSYSNRSILLPRDSTMVAQWRYNVCLECRPRCSPIRRRHRLLDAALPSSRIFSISAFRRQHASASRNDVPSLAVPFQLFSVIHALRAPVVPQTTNRTSL